MTAQALPDSVEGARTMDRDGLAGRLAHRRWVRRTRPFAHVVAQNVFTPEFYDPLHAQVRSIVEDASTLRRNMGNYDASSTSLAEHQDGPLGVFLSRAWHDMLADIWNVEATGDVTATLHHHEPGGQSGWPHNDLNPAWFPGASEPPPDETRTGDNSVVDHQHGTRAEGVDARECIRAVAVLFYLGNPEWERGDGGETALFESMSGASNGPSAAVAPINNSLVMFECTPFSWHSFRTNRKPRTSVVMWLHRRKEDAVARWGEQSIVYW